MKYGLLVVLGIVLGFVGEEMAVRIIHLLPMQFILSIFMPIFVLFVMLVPFLVAAFILTAKLSGYCSFWKGFVFSVAYYFPAQYRAIWISYNNPDNPLTGSLAARAGIILIGAFLLSGVYYLAVMWQRRVRRQLGT
jgi:hypothetical protein